LATTTGSEDDDGSCTFAELKALEIEACMSSGDAVTSEINVDGGVLDLSRKPSDGIVYGRKSKPVCECEGFKICGITEILL